MSKSVKKLFYISFFKIKYFIFLFKKDKMYKLRTRIELATFRLQSECSTTKLPKLFQTIRILYYTPQIIIVFCL